jgi:hypothetical protein
MKKNLFTLFGAAILCSLVFLSCQKKSDDSIRPTYKEENGTGGNPFPNNPTVTGTSTVSNPATQNSQLTVGGTGWSNPTCASTFSTSLKGVNGSIEVTLNFFAPPTTGTYVIAATPTSSQACSMSAVNVPNQPSGIIWYAKNGVVSVNTTSSSINASFSGIQCTQQNFNFPVVALNGVLGCN